jgi:3-deoxy-7-phosphoheptulonate synthase
MTTPESRAIVGARDTRVASFEPLASPRTVLGELPLTEEAGATVITARRELREILAGRDRRLVVVVGPCSIHDPVSALDYARRLAALRAALADRFLIVMRTYFEKPRTTIGWKGMIYDPGRDETHDMNTGLREARGLLRQINALGMPCATEFLDPIVPQYIADLVTWAAIGARTTESQTHRQMASGLSMPVGFKNSTDGAVQVALDAMLASTHAQSFLGIDPEGKTCIVRTRGNPDVHLILRGGTSGPNYSAEQVGTVRALIGEPAASTRSVMIDCSHGNSAKDYRKQPAVFRDVVARIAAGEHGLLGVMLESHLVEGKQAMGTELVYGQSITDGCIGWEATEALLRDSYAVLRHGR